jgi:uncharacterized protein YcbK (DUF882 family)
MKYFKQEEFACKCGCGYDAISPLLAERLDAAREMAGVPFIVNSGCRCPKHNKAVGGVDDSSHTLGLATDIHLTPGYSNRIIEACRANFDRIGIGATFIHVDVDESKPSPAEWAY